MDFRAILTYDMPAPLTAEQTAALAGALAGGAIVTAEPSGALTVEVTVAHDGPVYGALSRAAFDISEALQAARLRTRAGGLEPVAATIAASDWHTSRIVEPGMPGVVTLTEAAPILGVTQQRASQLAKDDPNFPDPLNPSSTTRVYDEQAMKEYAAARPRKAGRPKRTPS